MAARQRLRERVLCGFLNWANGANNAFEKATLQLHFQNNSSRVPRGGISHFSYLCTLKPVTVVSGVPVVWHGLEKSPEVKDLALVLSCSPFEFHLQLGLSYQTHLRARFQMERVTLYPPKLSQDVGAL